MKISEIQEKLDKLRRNEERMTPEQRRSYGKNLRAFRKQILDECNNLLLSVVSDGIWVLENDDVGTADILSRVRQTVKDSWWRQYVKETKQVLFSTYSVGEFLKMVFRLRIEIVYRAYGPYWVSKTQVDQESGVMSNQIMNLVFGINFRWVREHNQWESEDGTSAAIMLPPSMELLTEMYEKECGEIENARKVRG